MTSVATASIVPFNSTGPLPKSVYLDTSFLLDMVDATLPGASPKAMSCLTFAQRLEKEAADLCTSPLTIEECFHKIVTRGIRKDMAKLSTPNRTLSEYRRSHPVEYERSKKVHLMRLIPVFATLQRFDILIGYPMEWPEKTDHPAEVVTQWARRYYERYPSLDSADAFHIAMSRLWPTDALASADDGFRQVVGLTLCCP